MVTIHLFLTVSLDGVLPCPQRKTLLPRNIANVCCFSVFFFHESLGITEKTRDGSESQSLKNSTLKAQQQNNQRPESQDLFENPGFGNGTTTWHTHITPCHLLQTCLSFARLRHGSSLNCPFLLGHEAPWFEAGSQGVWGSKLPSRLFPLGVFRWFKCLGNLKGFLINYREAEGTMGKKIGYPIVLLRTKLDVYLSKKRTVHIGRSFGATIFAMNGESVYQQYIDIIFIVNLKNSLSI